MTIDEIKSFRQLGSKTAGHPEHGHAPGIETTTGPLGQGIANAVGMAIAERHLRAALRRRPRRPPHLCASRGDGCLMEGISQEAISLAGHLKPRQADVLFDNNGISIDGADLARRPRTTSSKRFEAAGWHVQAVDGHDQEAVDARHPQGAQRHRPARR